MIIFFVIEETSHAGGFSCAFRPTSEFLQFHGYGESIQANDPDEAKLIKKIIEDAN